MGIPLLGILPHIFGTENILFPEARSNPNKAAAGNQTRRLEQNQAAIDCNLVCPWMNLGVQTSPGRTPGIVGTICRPF